MIGKMRVRRVVLLHQLENELVSLVSMVACFLLRMNPVLAEIKYIVPPTI